MKRKDDETFACAAARLAWELFKATGYICYYSLYANITNPPKVEEIVKDKDDGMEL